MAIGLALSALCDAGPAYAQVPAAPAPAPPPPAAQGSSEFSFVNTGGNANSTSVGVRGELVMRPHEWLLKTRLAFVRLESDEALEAQSFTALFRGQRSYSPQFSLFGQYDYLRDLFAGLEHKSVISGGVSHKTFETPRHSLALDGGFGITNERRLDAEDLTAAVLLGGATYKVKVSETTEITEDVRYEQSIDHGTDWRADNTAAVITKINSVFSLKLSNVVRYAHAPVAGFESTDTVTSVALVAKF